MPDGGNECCRNLCAARHEGTESVARKAKTPNNSKFYCLLAHENAMETLKIALKC